MDHLNKIDKEIIAVSIPYVLLTALLTTLWQGISSLVSGVYDGWTTKCRCPFLSFSIQFVHSPQHNPYKWSLNTHLLAFKHTVGHHTGEMLGQELMNIVREFELKDKVSFMYEIQTAY